MAQTAILTFTDSGDDEVSVKLTFEPAVKGNATMTPAIQMAMLALNAASANQDDTDDD